MLCLWRSVRDGAQWPRLLRTAGTLSDGDVYDVAIVGGGMVGAALAALLGEAVRHVSQRHEATGAAVEAATTSLSPLPHEFSPFASVNNPLTASMRVIVLDQKVNQPTAHNIPRPCPHISQPPQDYGGSGAQPLDWRPAEVPELRVSTLTPASISYLQRAGAWQDVQPWAAAFSAMQVSGEDAGRDPESLGGGSAPGGASGACIRWHASDASMEHMGVVVENSRLQTALLAAAAGRPQPETPQSQAWSPDPGLADSLGIKDLSSASGAAGGASSTPGSLGGGVGAGRAATAGQAGAGAGLGGNDSQGLATLTLQAPPQAPSSTLVSQLCLAVHSVAAVSTATGCPAPSLPCGPLRASTPGAGLAGATAPQLPPAPQAGWQVGAPGAPPPPPPPRMMSSWQVHAMPAPAAGTSPPGWPS
ncbi:FAD_binding_3 domain-containing protein [Haematococcus lacustris]|uniref:FAD_binding_3 domain-containing protein n=1 Tax=Haematococcus lacustris TaxID=44745 RepID=A0A699ZCH4_HAELA|nr:FAD_binding_3 domain-containing protein [Haematococcus lacustris]